VDAVSLLSAVLALAASVAGAWAVYRAAAQDAGVRRLIEEHTSETRVRVKALSEEVEQMLDRVTAERKRIDGRRGGRPREEAALPENGGRPWTIQTYTQWCEQTGRSLPEVERALGI